jgi:hypothetical protein
MATNARRERNSFMNKIDNRQSVLNALQLLLELLKEKSSYASSESLQDMYEVQIGMTESLIDDVKNGVGI